MVDAVRADLLDRLDEVEVGAVGADEVRRAELAGERLLGRVGVDRDDRQARRRARAPWITLRPMPPTPITTTDWPWVTLARLNTAPTPVSTPQPMSEAEVNGTSSGIGIGGRGLDDRLLDEDRRVGELERLLAVDGERPGELAEARAAERRLAAVARGAVAAVAERRQHDVVADLHVRHVVGDLR